MKKVSIFLLACLVLGNALHAQPSALGKRDDLNGREIPPAKRKKIIDEQGFLGDSENEDVNFFDYAGHDSSENLEDVTDSDVEESSEESSLEDLTAQFTSMDIDGENPPTQQQLPTHREVSTQLSLTYLYIFLRQTHN